MKSAQSNTWIINITTALLIILWGYTATSKLLSIDKFIAVLGYAPLIGPYAEDIGVMIPVTEIILMSLLLIPPLRVYGLTGSVIFLSGLTSYLFYMLVTTPHLPCSCGGVLKQLTWKQHFVFNLFFIAAGVTGWKACRKQKLFIAINRQSRIPV